jgi:tetratricopeptide (TPR) repeat protein
MKQKEKMEQERHSFTLRLTQFTVGEDEYSIEIALEGGGLPRQTATSHFDFKLTDQDREDIRWYLEDFLQYPHDPAPNIAARIEEHMDEIGTELFKSLFQSSDDARDLWATLRTHLNETRVEIVTTVAEATSIPWELLRDPKTDVPLALRARSFVHAHPQAAQVPQIPEAEAGPIHILLVICRPGGRDDVPFRSVASRLVKGLSEDARALFQLDVLRPPTFEQLGRVLRHAKSNGQPYHIVHFDGHGGYVDATRSGNLLISAPRSGSHGYILFENPVLGVNTQLVDGHAIGSLLAETDVPVLVLNACRSAYTNPPTFPVVAESKSDDPHSQVRAFGSLAQEVMDAGATGVVAMRYTVYVATAAQFVADLYASLTQGHTLGEAVTLCRKQLADAPLRDIDYELRRLQDWSVPVVYEAASISLFPAPDTSDVLTITLNENQGTPSRDNLDPKLPKIPDAGFFGRDETILALDRAFDAQKIVLLHAYAGSGKTATIGEFARWYALTGGVPGPVLFTSFEQYQPLARVLDRIGDHFGSELERTGIHWLALDDCERRNVALQVLKQKPVLWIWDSVEPVAGFPSGTESAWNKEEQQELVDFLRDCKETKAKFLLTSRRDERRWLSDLPARITIPPMPMWERVQFARAIAEKHGRRLTKIGDWRPLLEFTQGNPLTITVVVGQALRDGLDAREQIGAFVERLRAGEAAFDDELSEGRSRSLGASLSYGFEHAFSEGERRQLALLHLFQGFVNVGVLRLMGDSEADWCLPEVRGLTSESGIVLLDRADEIGLLTAIGGGYYAIHPALPWFFGNLFNQYYTSAAGGGEDLRAARAFVEAMGWWGNYYLDQYGAGDRDVIAALTAEEANLLHARKLARMYGWWHAVIGAMQGLRTLYSHTGRRAEWARLVDEIVPDFADSDTDGPLPGRGAAWSLVTKYHVRLAREARQWAEAEHLQRPCVGWDRKQAAAALAASPKALDDAQRKAIYNLAESLNELGEIQRELGQSECVAAYEESLMLSKRIGDCTIVATCAFNLGTAYNDISTLRDLDQAERWYQRSLELHEERDLLGRAHCLGQLGLVVYERFKEARAAKKPGEELLQHINAALQYYQQALGMFPPNAVGDLAVTHNQLGIIYQNAGNLDRALSHYRESIRYEEIQGNLYGAAQARLGIALALARAGRLADALEYARAALSNFETYGEGAAEAIQRTQELIAQIEQDMQAQGG